MSEDFKKKNPQHTVPTLDDDGNYLWDSHAIGTYLIEKYAPDDSLYPKDLLTRAKVDQRLHFDTGILFPRLRGTLEPIFFKNCLEFPDEKKEAITQAYEFLEKFLEEDLFLVGNSLTIADLCAIATTESLNTLVEIDENKYPNVVAWMKRLQELPYYSINREGAEKLAEMFHAKMG